MVTVEPSAALPPAGVCAITLPSCELVDGDKLTATSKPASWSSDTASARDMPTVGGTVTCLRPDETTSVTVAPRTTALPGARLLVSTALAGTARLLESLYTS